jgi:hypothetical protein
MDEKRVFSMDEPIFLQRVFWMALLRWMVYSKAS